jgi:hypothetical protein
MGQIPVKASVFAADRYRRAQSIVQSAWVVREARGDGRGRSIA